jgi:putative ABC transport system substrate-binding protein
VDRLPALADELVRLKADVIVLGNPAAARAVLHATSTIPVVMVSSDPLGLGLVTNLGRPGGNLTGLSTMSTELLPKRLQLLKEALPGLKRLAVLWHDFTPGIAKRVEDLKSEAPSLGLELKVVRVQAPEEFVAAFTEISQSNVQALYLVESPLFYGHRKTLAALALKARLPAMYSNRLFVEDGGFMTYGVDFRDQNRRAAGYVDRILKGAKPGDLPVEQATKLELVINLRTAKALGLTVPPSILARADDFIR